MGPRLEHDRTTAIYDPCLAHRLESGTFGDAGGSIPPAPPQEGTHVKREMAVVPDSDLARFLAKLKRPERRMLLGLLQAAPGPKRQRMERELQRRIAEKKL